MATTPPSYRTRHLVASSRACVPQARSWAPDKIQEDDRISIEGLTTFKPGLPLTMVAKHKDGSEDRITLNHTYNDQQIAWFKAGSALNLMGKK